MIVVARSEHLEVVGAAIGVAAVQPRRSPQAEHGPATGEVEQRLALRPVVEGVVPQAIDAPPDRDQDPATSKRGSRVSRDTGRGRQVSRHDAPPPRTYGRHHVLNITHMSFQ